MGSTKKPSNRVEGYNISSGYGSREAPLPGASTYHKGVDYGAYEGIPFLVGLTEKGL